MRTKTILTFTMVIFCMVNSGYSEPLRVYLGHPDSDIVVNYFNGLIDYIDSQPDIRYVMRDMIPPNLSRYDLYVTYSAGLSSHGLYEYSEAEILTLNNYLQSGGRLLFFSDHTAGGGPGQSIDPYLNQLLPQLGSNMTLNGGVFDGGGHQNSIPGQILSNPFTNNVELIRYAATNSISGGIQTLLTSNLTDCFFSYEQIGNGYLFLSGDINLMDFAGNPAYDSGQFFRNLIEVPKPVLAVNIDIKPGDCPNPLNVKSKGVLPVAILGSEDFDVAEIDVLSVQLAGVVPSRSDYEDVATALVDANECECSAEGPDGYLDLTLKFDTQAIVGAIGEINNGDEWVLELTGALYDDTLIAGEDCVIIRAKSDSKN